MSSNLQKTLHTIVFDVSGSMQAPLKLRSNAQDANKGSEDLEPKRVQTVFDVICRLSEDSIVAAKDQDMYAAVLCFGLRHVSTCDLLALLEERTKVLEMLDVVETQSISELPYNQAAALLSRHGLSSSYLTSTRSSNSGQLYKVVGRQPLVKLLASAGAPYCDKYIEDHTTPELAGKYFMAFAGPDRQRDLRLIVERLPDACKTFFSASRFAANHTGFLGSSVSGYAASEAISHADQLIAGYDTQSPGVPAKQDVRTLLRSIPNASPRPINNVIQLIKRLQSALDPDKKGTSTSVTQDMNWERLLDDIEPYLYGGTPMCQALRSVLPLFQTSTYSSKVMVLISDGEATDGNPLPPAQALRDSGGTIFACLLTDSILKDPRRLRGGDEVDKGWSRAARNMFDMASTVSTDSGAVQALRRRGWSLPASGQCKLFIQANNPTIIDEFTMASRKLGTSADALADMFGEIKLDDYIQESNEDAKATDQMDRPVGSATAICWAHATASVIHLASHRVVGRDVPEFLKIRDHLLSVFGDDNKGQNIGLVLSKVCSSYSLRFQRCDELGARAGIHARRPVIATFSLDVNRWKEFSKFYEYNPKGMLTKKDLNGPAGGAYGGHAVVLVRCDETSLTFMNSWGPEFGNNGFFTIDKPSTLELEGGSRMQFWDIYWTTDDLSAGEVASWKKHAAKSGKDKISGLPKSFHDLPVGCPHCKHTAPAHTYKGSWNEARCSTCSRTFVPTVAALVQTLYESNYDPV
ncbi:unnamed protein product [Sphagnum balticum]